MVAQLPDPAIAAAPANGSARPCALSESLRESTLARTESCPTNHQIAGAGLAGRCYTLSHLRGCGDNGGMNIGVAQMACPQCGRGTSVRTLPELLQGRDGADARAQRTSTEPLRPQPASWTAPDYTLGDGEDVSAEQGLFDAGLAVTAEVLRRTVGRAVKKRYAERALPQMQQRRDELRRRQLELFGRHPDLRCCVDDEILFLPGHPRTLPLNQAAQFATAEQFDAAVASLRAP